MVQLWYDFTMKIMVDHEAVQALGWVREMWGYCIATGSLGIKHRVLDAFQFEGAPHAAPPASPRPTTCRTPPQQRCRHPFHPLSSVAAIRSAPSAALPPSVPTPTTPRSEVDPHALPPAMRQVARLAIESGSSPGPWAPPQSRLNGRCRTTSFTTLTGWSTRMRGCRWSCR